MKIDLHTHTNASDGIMSPQNLVDHAEANGVKVLAISDHDTVNALPAALNYAAGRAIEIVPAIELSIDFNKSGTFHLVGMFIDYENKPLKSKLSWLAERRATRAQRMVDDLTAHGIGISMDEVMAEAAGGVIGKPHIARVLIKHKFVRDMSAVFENFLEEGLPGYVPKDKISFEEAMLLIKGAGGIGILAHPASLNLKKPRAAFTSFLAKLKEGGLAGLEAYSDMHTPKMIDFYIKSARSFGLLVSGGSDFHGDKNEQIGCYDRINPVPAHLYQPIKEYAKKNC